MSNTLGIKLLPYTKGTIHETLCESYVDEFNESCLVSGSFLLEFCDKKIAVLQSAQFSREDWLLNIALKPVDDSPEAITVCEEVAKLLQCDTVRVGFELVSFWNQIGVERIVFYLDHPNTEPENLMCVYRFPR